MILPHFERPFSEIPAACLSLLWNFLLWILAWGGNVLHAKAPLDIYLVKQPMVYYTPKEFLTLTKWNVREYWTGLFCGLVFFFCNGWVLCPCTPLWCVLKFANVITAWKFQIGPNGSVTRGHNPEVPETCLDLLVVTVKQWPRDWWNLGLSAKILACHPVFAPLKSMPIVVKTARI